ncbi:MAG: LytR family transcriptional regulator [Homoserinimonas sp.]|nr:LytR family transcriptional regulator [Homoserinimonas sp.]
MGETRQRAQGAATVSGIARHGRLKRHNPFFSIIKMIASAMAVVLVSGACVAAITISQFEQSIDTVQLVGAIEGPPPALSSFEGCFYILVVGSDRCESDDGCAGRGSANLNDVNILLHVSEDQSNIVAVSFPRDLVVPIPSCPKENGKGNNSAMSARPINEALYYGGLPCVALTVEKLTGLKIPFAGLITFNGVVNMSTAIGGVTVCTTGPVIDKYAGINLPSAGEHELAGASALAFLRSRHGVGDGSDLGRISSQQVFMSSLVRKLTSEGALNDPVALFGLAQVATQSMQLSESLKNVTTLVSMASVLKDIDLNKITFVQYPGTTGQDGVYAGKVAPIKATAEALFAKIRSDELFTLQAGNTGRGSVLSPDVTAAPEEPATPGASAAPQAPVTPGAEETPAVTEAELLSGVLGQTAADHTCSKANN